MRVEETIIRIRHNYWADVWEVRETAPSQADELVPRFDVLCAGTKKRCEAFLLAAIMATPIDELFREVTA